MEHLTEEWSPEGYLSLGNAVVADAFRIYLYALQELYTLDHWKMKSSKAVRERHVKIKRRTMRRKVDRMTLKTIRIKAEDDIRSVEKFIEDEMSWYTSLEPGAFRKAAQRQLHEWIKSPDGDNKKSRHLDRNVRRNNASFRS